MGFWVFNLFRLDGSDHNKLILSILCNLLVGLMEPIFIFTLGKTIDILILNTEGDIKMYLIIQGVLAGTSLVLNMLGGVLIENLAEKVIFNMKCNYVCNVLHQEMAWFETRDNMDLTTILNQNCNIIRDLLGVRSMKIFKYISMFISSICFSFYTSWKLGLVLFAVMPISIALGVYSIYSVHESDKVSLRSYNEANIVAGEGISKVQLIMQLCFETMITQSYEKALLKCDSSGRQISIGLSGMTAGVGCLKFIGYAIGYWFSGRYLYLSLLDECFKDKSCLHAGDIVSVLFVMLIASFSVSKAIPLLKTMNRAALAAWDLYVFIDRQSKIANNDPTIGVRYQQFLGDIRFENVSFSYPARPNVPILKDFTLHIPPGSDIALVGTTGSGKSTITQLILRLYDATSGAVLIDDRPISSYNVNWLRSHFGVVLQEPSLFTQTIGENIRFGNFDCSEEELNAAAEAAQIYDFIQELPFEFDTPVGEKGEFLSSGQRQRVSIARSLVRRPKILILDEAMSQVDIKTEIRLKNSIRDYFNDTSITFIHIAHRLSSIQNCDVIVMLGSLANEGKNILEKGDHGSLIRNAQGIYRALMIGQMDGEEQQLGGQDEEDLDGDAMIKQLKSVTSLTESKVGNNLVTELERLKSEGKMVVNDPRQGLVKMLSTAEGMRDADDILRKMKSLDQMQNKYDKRVTKKPEEYGELTANELLKVKSLVNFQNKYIVADNKDHQKEDAEVITHLKDKLEFEALNANADIFKEKSVRNQLEISATSLGTLFLHLKNRPFTLIGGLILALLNGMYFPLCGYMIANYLIVFSITDPNTVLHESSWLAIYFIILGVSYCFTVWIDSYIWECLSVELITKLRKMLFSKIMCQGCEFHDEPRHTTDQLKAVLAQDTFLVRYILGEHFQSSLHLVSSLIISLIICGIINIKLTLVVFGITAVILFIFLIPINTQSDSARVGLEKANRLFLDAINDIKTVATFGLEDRFFEEYNDIMNTSKHILGYVNFRTVTILSFMEFVTQLAKLLGLWYGQKLYITNEISTLSSFMIIIFVFTLFALPLTDYPIVTDSINRSRGAARNIFNLLSYECGIDVRHQGERMEQLKNKIRFKDVDFVYPQRNTQVVFNKFSFDLPVGQTIAFIGESGCGKSSILQLVARMYDTLEDEDERGGVYLDGEKIKKINVSDVRRTYTYVKGVDLFRTSIGQNILMGRSDATDEEKVKAAGLALIHDFIMTLPDGYNTLISEAVLSTGQKQRICISRALLSNARVLILDECTSALDSNTEREVMKNIRRSAALKEQTVIMVAHNLNTVRHCDCIYVLEHIDNEVGTVLSEKGSHRDLLKIPNGLYAALWSIVKSERKDDTLNLAKNFKTQKTKKNRKYVNVAMTISR